MKDHTKAYELTYSSLYDAMDILQTLSEMGFQIAKPIIQIMKENLSLWPEKEENET